MKLTLGIHSKALQELINSSFKKNICLKYVINEIDDYQEVIDRVFASNNKSELLLKLDLMNIKPDWNHVDKKRYHFQGISVTVPLITK